MDDEPGAVVPIVAAPSAGNAYWEPKSSWQSALQRDNGPSRRHHKAMVRMAEQLRESIQEDERPLSELGDATGLSKANLSRFSRGQRGINLDTADRLIRAMGLECKPRRRRSR